MRRRTSVVSGVSALLLVSCEQRQPWRSELVSLAADGTPGASGDSGRVEADHSPGVSADGTRAVFGSFANDLVSGEPPTDDFTGDVFVRDLGTGMTQAVSVAHDGGAPGNGRSWDGVMSADRREVAFSSEATDPSSGPRTPMCPRAAATRTASCHLR